MLEEHDMLLSQDTLERPDHVRDTLARRVMEVLGQGANGVPDPHVVRLIVPIARVDPFAWLTLQPLWPRIYWHGRGDRQGSAAVGSADRCRGGPDAGYEALRAQLDAVLPRSDARARYFGGFRFDWTARTDDAWRTFGAFTFTLPRFIYRWRSDQAFLVCNLFLPRDVDHRDEILSAIDRLRFPVESLDHPYPVSIRRTDRPDRDGWRRNVAWVLDAFRNRRDELEKVVLARRTDLEFAHALDPFALLKRLEAETPNCFHYGFQFGPEAAFVGATPERLFRRDGRRVWTEAIAGTCPRGRSAGEDRRMLAALLSSEKDQREHACVRESIRAALAPLCTDFHIDEEASGLEQERRWHLVSRSSGFLEERVHGSDVMRALNPTPAVGGVPTREALAAIRNLEGFDRGWYAGPVGWIDGRGAEFAVALRCGLVRENVLSLFAGAGIVEGSDPDAEWDEVEQKSSDFFKVLAEPS